MRIKLAVAVLLVTGMVAVVQAQPGGRGFGGGPTGLVSFKAVQEDLKMTEDQVTKTTEWTKEFRTKAAEIRKDKGIDFKGGFPKGGFTPEMQEKMAAANAEISKVAYKELGEVLKKEQVVRLKQIDLQQQGVEAFTTADVADSLKLTDSQKSSIKGISTDFGKERREIMSESFKDKKFDAEKLAESQKKIAKLEKESLGKVTELLTDEQKKTWKGMTGEAFDLTKLARQPMKKKD